MSLFFCAQHLPIVYPSLAKQGVVSIGVWLTYNIKVEQAALAHLPAQGFTIYPPLFALGRENLFSPNQPLAYLLPKLVLYFQYLQALVVTITVFTVYKWGSRKRVKVE